MNNQYDWKKIIKMVAVIGVLCLFVGIATRLMQKSQTSLNDYARKNPEVAFAKPEDDKNSDSKSDDDKNSDGKAGESKADDGKADDDKSDDGKASDDKAVAGPGGVSEQEIYDNFYYTDEENGYTFRVMYFDKDHKVCKAELKGDVDDPQDTLQYFYDLFKAEHEFENYAQLKEFFDRFKVTDE